VQVARERELTLHEIRTPRRGSRPNVLRSALRT
jgi:hypothetical protein